MPEGDAPYLYLLIAGSLRLYTPSGMLDYVAGQYSISALDTPSFGYALDFSEEGDLPAVSITFTLDDVLAVVLGVEGDLVERVMAGGLPPQRMERADAHLVRAVSHLLSLLGERDGLAYMANLLKQEILFHTLCGSCGKPFLQGMIGLREAGEIYAGNRWIKQNYKTAFAVSDLAGRTHMSVSAFSSVRWEWAPCNAKSD